MTMLEQMSDGIGVIAEAQGETNQRLGVLETRFDGLETRFDGLESKIDRLQEDMDIVKSDVAKIKTDLKRKVDYDEFEKLEKRMLKVERRVFAKQM